jgi:hypothetical protein
MPGLLREKVPLADKSDEQGGVRVIGDESTISKFFSNCNQRRPLGGARGTLVPGPEKLWAPTIHIHSSRY